MSSLPVTDTALLHHHGYEVGGWIEGCIGCSDFIQIAFGCPAERQAIGVVSTPFLPSANRHRYYLRGPSQSPVRVPTSEIAGSPEEEAAWLAWRLHTDLGMLRTHPGKPSL
jgi:hypothetical protein